MPKTALTTFLLTLLVASALTGCGHGTSVAPIPELPSSDTALHPTQDAAPVTTPATTPVTPTNGGTGVSGCLGLGTCGDDAKLTLTGVTKTKVGFLWRKLEVKGKVLNSNAKPLSGELVIHFLSKGVVVDSEFKDFTGLNKGQSATFDIESSEAATDADVSIETDGVADPSATGPATTPLG